MKRFFRLIVLVSITFMIHFSQAQDFMMQGWYWDYPKTASGKLWADTLADKAEALADAGFTYLWLPPLSRAASGAVSNGYDPKDLYDLGEYGLGATGFGTRSDVDALITTLNDHGIQAVADVVLNHRDGGKPESNPAVAGWVRNMNWTKINNGDQPYPSDRFRLILTLGGGSGRGAGTYWFKFGSKSQHANFYNFPYKVYMETKTVGYQGLTPDSESEPNGGGGCGEGNNTIRLGVDMNASIDGLGCKIDEFALTLNSGDFNAAGDTLFIYLGNRNVTGLGSYSDHTALELYYSGGGGNIEGALVYQTWTDFTTMPSGSGAMNYLNFKPNGSATQLSGDWDAMYFFYDYDQYAVSTRTALFDWTRWLWNDAGIRGLRMDAVKHFPYAFVGDLLDHLHDNGIDPGMVVGEFYDGNSATLKGWVDNVMANMDADTKAAIQPRIFDFSLRSALEAASDQFGYDVRNVFNASMVDAQGASGFNAVTFTDNHDFRDSGQPIDNDPILAYAYILTNNQVGMPCVYYHDYYKRGLQEKIDDLMYLHRHYIYGATQRDYLSRFSTPYSQSFTSGYASTTLIYQLSGGVAGKDVIVAINYAGEPLLVTQQVNTTTMGLAVGDTLTDMLGNSLTGMPQVQADGTVQLQLPARSYSVWVKGGEMYRIKLEAKVLLEGPYDSSLHAMSTHLTASMPTQSPYPEDPCTVSSIPADVTDWVLVQLRSDPAGPALASTSALLRNDGRLLSNEDGTTALRLLAAPGTYYPVIVHRNHVAALCSSIVIKRMPTPLRDFTMGANHYYGTDTVVELEPGIWGLWCGDMDQDHDVDVSDYASWLSSSRSGDSGYQSGDFNLDGHVTTLDYTKWFENARAGAASPMP